MRPRRCSGCELGLECRLLSRELDHLVDQAVGGGPHRSNFTSGGLELSPEVSELGGELLLCNFLWMLAVPLAVRRALLSRAGLSALLTGGVMKITGNQATNKEKSKKSPRKNPMSGTNV